MNRTSISRRWFYVFDNQLSGRPDLPAGTFSYPPGRGGKHPHRHLACYVSILHADAYYDFSELRLPVPAGAIIEAASQAQGGWKFLVDVLPWIWSRPGNWSKPVARIAAIDRAGSTTSTGQKPQ